MGPVLLVSDIHKVNNLSRSNSIERSSPAISHKNFPARHIATRYLTISNNYRMPPEDWKSHTYPTTSWKNRMSLHPTKGKQHPDDLFPTRYREHSCLTHLPDDANDYQFSTKILFRSIHNSLIRVQPEQTNFRTDTI